MGGVWTSKMNSAVFLPGACNAYLSGTCTLRRVAGCLAHALGCWMCACVQPLPSIPGEGGSCDVRSFNPETAAAVAAESTEPWGCRWLSPQASEIKGRDPEAEAHRSLNSGEWSQQSCRSRLGGSVRGLLGWGIGCRAVRLILSSSSRSLPLPALGTQAPQHSQDLLCVSVTSGV